MANVIFKTGTIAQYNALPVKNSNTLYWLTDVQEIRRGEDLYGVGRLATNEMAGLLSPEDKKKYDALVAGTIGASNLTSVDASVLIEKSEDGQMIRVGISEVDGNVLTVKDDGLYVPEQKVPEFSIEKQGTSEDGYIASYRLKRTYGDEVSYVGDVINIPKDLVLQNASMETVSVVDVPYAGAKVGDPYLDLVFNDENASHIYVPVRGLLDTYVAGGGIEIVDSVIGVKLDGANTNGLFVTDDGIGLQLATFDTAGAMSAEDKVAVDSLPEAYEKVKYEISSKPDGALVDYRDKEIRVMCPADTRWEKQNIDATGDANAYYMGFKAYAPDDAVSFKKDNAEIISDSTMYYFENNDVAGIDKYDRKYSICWFAIAKYDEETDTWSYYGAKSNENKYIGWYYSVEWYDASGKIISTDTIRINLSNEDCHANVESYYMANYVTNEDLEDVQDTIASMGQSLTWGDM